MSKEILETDIPKLLGTPGPKMGVDLYLRDTVDDPGNDFLKNYATKPFWDSPDLWVRNQDDGEKVQAHQNPVAGKANWFYARVSNRGTQPAYFFLVAFKVAPFLGTEFLYPNDYMDAPAAMGWFFSSGLKPGESAIVKKEMNVPAMAHPCWLATVLTEGDMPPAGIHSWEGNNLAQKNLYVVNLKPGATERIPIQLGSQYRILPEVFRLEVLRPKGWEHIPVALEHAKAHEVEEIFKPTGETPFLRREGELTLDKKGAFHLAYHPGMRAGFPIALAAGKLNPFNLHVTVPREAKAKDVFDLHLVQRNAKEKVVGGFTVRVNVV